jgi:hypothetical protein
MYIVEYLRERLGEGDGDTLYKSEIICCEEKERKNTKKNEKREKKILFLCNRDVSVKSE